MSATITLSQDELNMLYHAINTAWQVAVIDEPEYVTIEARQERLHRLNQLHHKIGAAFEQARIQAAALADLQRLGQEFDAA